VAYRAGGVSQGEMLVSIMIEFWLPETDTPGAPPGFHGAGGGGGGSQRSPYMAAGAYTRPLFSST
jgi:hypothetical protein